MSKLQLSPKQRQAVFWWKKGAPTAHYDGILCDGAIRSGKTLSLGLGFFLWAMTSFRGCRFALCGKTVGAVRRNVLMELLPKLTELGMDIQDKRSENRIFIRFLGRENDFFLFGGGNESSQDLIQGMTLAGVLLDEATLMPKSFVEQACARCSVAGAKIFINCNPSSPRHWLYEEWILKAQARNFLHLHFTMADNPALTPAVRKRYENLYEGAFYRRYVLGQWVQAEGRVYDFFDTATAPPAPKDGFTRWFVSCDYGTVNPASFGLWGEKDGVYYRVKEYYYDSRLEGKQLTDEEYADALENLVSGRPISAVVADPSAASFMAVLRRRGFTVWKGKNDVLSGIRLTSSLLKSGKLVICRECTDCLREMDLYLWDKGDTVKKENDHAMDDMRYFAATVLRPPAAGFAACTVERGRSYGFKEEV